MAASAEDLIKVHERLALDDAVAMLAEGRTAVALTLAVDPHPRANSAGRGGGWWRRESARSAGEAYRHPGGRGRWCATQTGAGPPTGSDLTVHYRNAGWADWLRGEVGGVAVVYDGVGGQIGRDSFDLLDSSWKFGMASGSFATVPDAERAEVTRVWALAVTPSRSLELARSALDQAADGRLRPVIGQRFALELTADAHAAIETRSTIGKTSSRERIPAVRCEMSRIPLPRSLAHQPGDWFGSARNCPGQCPGPSCASPRLGTGSGFG